MQTESDSYLVVRFDRETGQYITLCWDEYFRHNPGQSDVRKFANKGLAKMECDYLDRHGFHGCEVVHETFMD
jgi:hypothetical protein